MLELVEFALPIMQAAALIIARPLGFLLVFPLFTWLGLEGMIRNVVALAIGLPLIGGVYDDLAASAVPFAAEFIMILAAKEFLIGVVLAVIFGVPFWAAEMAGGYVDVYRGSSVATVVSPTQMSDPLISGAIFSIALVAIFLSVGGLRTVIAAIYQSFEIWPLFEVMPNISANLYPIFVEILSKVARIGLALGAPILIAMFVGELCLAFTSRIAPQINIFDAMLSIKNIIFLVFLPPYLHFLTLRYGPDILDLEGLTALLMELAGP